MSAITPARGVSGLRATIPRNEGESQEDYKVRRKADHEATYNAAYYGKTVWDSPRQGTYVRATLKVLSKKALKKLQLKGGK